MFDHVIQSREERKSPEMNIDELRRFDDDFGAKL